MIFRTLYRYGVSKWTAEAINRLEDVSSLTARENEVRLQALNFLLAIVKDQAEEWEEKSVFPRDALGEAAKLGYSAMFVGGRPFSRAEASLIL